MYPAATRLRYSVMENCQSTVSLPVGVRAAVDGPSASHLAARRRGVEGEGAVGVDHLERLVVDVP
eukprot:3513121-Pyramimonas_sp.AAC.1